MMNREMVEEAAAWQQLYRSWLQLAGCEAAAGMLTEWNEQMLEQWQSAMEPAWQIPLRWFEDMNRIIEGSDAPEPIQAVALEAVRSGKNGLEAAQRYSARWFQAVSAVHQGEEDPSWMAPAMAAGQVWSEALDNMLVMNANLFAVLTGGAEVAGIAAAENGEERDIDVQETPAAEKTDSSAKAGSSGARRATKAAPPSKGQAVPPDLTL